ncbi:MAG: Protoporphyrinogen oxidase [Actinomycetia bacterium]|nr:Protoporphyrinogen oxidase [Actinomycetes bacterium]
MVIGGGIAGLAAAHRITRDAPGTAVTVLDQAAQPGGKLRTAEAGGVTVETAAEAFLVRRPEALDLAAEVGLAGELIHPRTLAASVATLAGLRPLPAGTLMGIPRSLDGLGGLLSPAALAVVGSEPDRPGDPVAEDVSIGAYARERLGAELVRNLVDPLLGGVYAGRAEGLSLHATVPGLAGPLREHPSLVRAARAAFSPGNGGPVFATVRGGLGRFAGAVAAASKADVRLGVTARELHRTTSGWRIVTGPVPDPGDITADAVVLAVPAPAAARLLAQVGPAAAAELAGIGYASIALVTLVLPGSASLPPGSGALIPAREGHLVKAVTFSSQKWGTGDGLSVVRASIGRYGEEHELQHPDEVLAARARDELSRLFGTPVPDPLDTRVDRWGGALPQYAVGHLGRIRRARAALAAEPTLALAGAAYDGVGIPACIASGQSAAAQITAALTPTLGEAR